EWQHVMLAQGIQLDILNQYHLAVCLVKFGGIENGGGVHFVALGDELHGLGHALRGLQQALALRILTDGLKYSFVMGSELVGYVRVVCFVLPVSHLKNKK